MSTTLVNAAATEAPGAVTTTRTPPSLADLSRRRSRRLFATFLRRLVDQEPYFGERMVGIHVNFLDRSIIMKVDRRVFVDAEEEEEEEEGSRAEKRRRMPAAKSAIEAMAMVTVMEEGFECAICLKDFEVGGEIQMAKQMPCKHKYHGECIEKWLGIHRSCPTCRYEMPVEEFRMGQETEGDEDEEDEDEDEDEDEGISVENGVVFKYLVDGVTAAVYQNDSDLESRDYIRRNYDSDVTDSESDSDSDVTP